MNKSLTKTSKFLSLVLRHRPEAIGLQLDSEGWLVIEELVDNANSRGETLTRQLIDEVVATSDKKRFAISADGQRIRASQGHSVAEVDLNLEPVEPPAILFHGTVAKFLESIRSQGLRKRTRNHVHLSPDQLTAEKVGSRRGRPVILIIDAESMNQSGIQFFRSANGVWLTDAVPARFITFPADGGA
ncbi:RNA 2'-phosphotransferase [Planctomycetes bacterium K23_9]|uniref:Probable RNA 2'-phosphotransferase n=1 Tax=Stieleria marina TaxID=1930275 RepID=A0A517NWV8_9BACT|nr:RNA 2'-phosphotransferase [Planctomycetes bacterium K23_9]